MAAIARPYLDADFARLAEIRNDLELQRQLMVRPTPQTEQQVADWIQRRSAHLIDLFCVLADESSDECIGFAQAVDREADPSVALLGIAIHRSFQGKGHGTSGLESFLATCASNGIATLNLTVLASNGAAVALYQRCGFVLDAATPPRWDDGQQLHDVYQMTRQLA